MTKTTKTVSKKKNVKKTQSKKKPRVTKTKTKKPSKKTAKKTTKVQKVVSPPTPKLILHPGSIHTNFQRKVNVDETKRICVSKQVKVYLTTCLETMITTLLKRSMVEMNSNQLKPHHIFRALESLLLTDLNLGYLSDHLISIFLRFPRASLAV